MSGYGTYRWTCGECGDTYEASGVVGDLKVNRWASDHHEMHRVEKLSPEERQLYTANKLAALEWSVTE